jgi:hypothetical protein
MVQIHFLNFQDPETVWEYDVQDAERLMKERDGKQPSLYKIEKLWILLLVVLKGPLRDKVIHTSVQYHLYEHCEY